MPRVKGDSKDAILDAALTLFSERGYSATTVRDIADAVGMKAASLYNHFKGKQEIFDALVAREVAYVEKSVRAEGAVADPADDPHAYSKAFDGDIYNLVWRSYLPFFIDERIKRFRRMLAMSRYDDANCADLYERIFIGRPVELQEAIYSHLIGVGLFAECDVHLAAMEFHGPMFMLMDAGVSTVAAEGFCKSHAKAFNAAHKSLERKAGK